MLYLLPLAALCAMLSCGAYGLLLFIAWQTRAAR